MTRATNQSLTASLVFAAALLFGPRLAAGAPTVRIAGPQTLQLVDAAGQPAAVWSVGSEIQDVLQMDMTLYVACGPRGILIFDLGALGQPALIGHLAEGRNVVKLTQNGRALLAVVAHFSALTFSLADPQHPQPAPLNSVSAGSAGSPEFPRAGDDPGEHNPAPAAVAPVLRVPRAGWARVSAVRGGWISVTTTAPVQVGDRFVVHSQRRVRVNDPTLTRKLYVPSDEPMGMFQVSRVSSDGTIASGPLPRGTVARRDDLAEPTAAPMYAPKVAPQLWYGMGRFYGTLRPIIGLSGTSGQYDSGPFGMLNDFTLEYYFRVPIKLGVQVAPLGLAVGSRVGVSTEVRALVSFASSYFELGLEPGGELHLYGTAQLVLGYMLRIGSLDGLNLIFRNSFFVDTRQPRAQLQFSGLAMEINIPLTSRFNLYLSGGGASRWGYGAIGLKYYLRGGGGPGTLIISSGAGGAWVNDHCEADSNSTNTAYCRKNAIETLGPALSVGLDARF